MIEEAVATIRRKIGEFNPEFGVMLATALGQLADEIDVTDQMMCLVSCSS